MSDLVQPSETLHGDSPAAATPQAILDRRELAFVAVERTRMPMVVTDPRQADNPIVMANQAFLNLTGYGADEVVGRNCRFLQGQGTSPVAVSQIRSAVAEERELTVELLNYRKDGSSFWNQLHLSPIHDDLGRLAYFFASQVDITEYRKAQSLEAAERRLLREVDHRALNVLAIVEGIVRLSRADDPTHYAISVQRRVHALARAHVLLADQGWTGAPVEHLVRQSLELYGGSRVSVDGPDVSTSARLVQPLALVLHELAANAASHGALSSPTGSVAVRWQEDPTPKGLTLCWEEIGGPPPPQERKPGFGATMIQAIVERQLKGEYRPEWTPDGLKAVLTLPDARD